MSDPILIAKGETDIFLLPQMANRHGLVAGATGTGKTVSLQVLAEGLSHTGVSVLHDRRQGRPLRDQPARPGNKSQGHRARSTPQA